MKLKAFDQAPAAAPPLKRRGLLLGVGAAGAAAIAAKVVPGTSAPAAEALAAAKPVLADTGGYQLSAHVLRYYETTRV